MIITCLATGFSFEDPAEEGVIGGHITPRRGHALFHPRGLQRAGGQKGLTTLHHGHSDRYYYAVRACACV